MRRVVVNRSIDSWISDHIDDDTRQEWIDALRSLVREEGKQQAKLLLDALEDEARVLGISQTKAPTPPTETPSLLKINQHFRATLRLRNDLPLSCAGMLSRWWFVQTKRMESLVVTLPPTHLAPRSSRLGSIISFAQEPMTSMVIWFTSSHTPLPGSTPEPS